MVRSRGKKDENQDNIVKRCRSIGMQVVIISQYKAHEFDLLIGWKRQWKTFEVNSDNKRKLTDRECLFAWHCNDKKLPHYQIKTYEDVLEAFK